MCRLFFCENVNSVVLFPIAALCLLYCAPDTPHMIYRLSGATASHLRADAASATSAAPPQRVQLLPLAHLLTTASGAQRHRHSCLHHSAHAHYPTAFACAHTLSLSQMSSLSPHWCDTQKELITASSPSCSSASDTRQL